MASLPSPGPAVSWRMWASFVVFYCLSCFTSGVWWGFGFEVICLFILLLVGLVWGLGRGRGEVVFVVVIFN